MKIIQDFKCYDLNENEFENKSKHIDFEITKYQQTIWKFYHKKIYFIESSLHWNMLLFYIYKNNNLKLNNIKYEISKKINNYYTLNINIKEIDKELELILFTFFYYDLHNRNENFCIDDKLSLYKWNNFYIDLKTKKIKNNLLCKIK